MQKTKRTTPKIMRRAGEYSLCVPQLERINQLVGAGLTQNEHLRITFGVFEDFDNHIRRSKQGYA
jgi:hypothetical protein